MKIKNLLFENLNENFSNTIDNVYAETNLSKEEIESHLEDNINGFVEEFDKSIIDLYLNRYKVDLTKFIRMKNKNEKHIIDCNKELFTYYFSYLNTMHIILNKIEKNSSILNKNFGVALSIYTYTLRLADQIGIQLLNGYDDGAKRLWRTLFEYSIVGIILISENNDELTDRYIDHGIKFKKRGIKNLGVISSEKLDKKEVEKVNNEHNRIKNKYEKNFFKDNGWANILFNKERIYISDLAKHVNLSDLLLFYHVSSEEIHSSSNFIQSYYSNGFTNIALMKDPSIDNESIFDPMQITLNVLHRFNLKLLPIVSQDEELDINIKFLKKIYQKLQDSYLDKN